MEKMISKIEALVDELIMEKISLSTGYLKARSINASLKNQKLQKLIDGEFLYGYVGTTGIPKYRISDGTPTLVFKNYTTGKHQNVPIFKAAKYIKNLIPELEEFKKVTKGGELRIFFTDKEYKGVIGLNNVKRVIARNVGWKVVEGYWTFKSNPFPLLLKGSSNKLIDILLQVKSSLENNSKDESGFFVDNSNFDATLAIRNLIQQATIELIIIDGYIGADTLKIISSKNVSCSVKLLTDKRSKTQELEHLVKTFNKQFGNLEVRYTSAFHDRYIIIDNSSFYSVGASLKDVGNKTFSIVKMNETTLTKPLIDKFNIEWDM